MVNTEHFFQQKRGRVMRSFTIYIEDERTKKSDHQADGAEKCNFRNGSRFYKCTTPQRRGREGERERERHPQREREGEVDVWDNPQSWNEIDYGVSAFKCSDIFPRQEGRFAKGAKSFAALSKCTRRLTT